MQARVPAAVGAEESPLPPACCGRHRTWGVWRAMTAMSSGVVPTSGPVMYLPPSAYEAWFVSTAIDDAALDVIATALQHAARSAAGAGS